MNYKMTFYVLGNILKIVAGLLLIPMFVALGYGESVLPFVWTILMFLGVGFACGIKSPKDRTMYTKEGIVIVGLAWILISAIGCMPYVFSGNIPYYFDAFFELVSGITTTGASVVNNVEGLLKGINFWRTFTHFIGGMGILVFVLAVMPKSEASSIHLLKAESAGPSVGKITSKIKTTALILYGLYSGMMLICFVMLLCGGLNWYDALTLSFSISGTGGFSNYSAGLLHFNSLYVEIVATVFMLLFSVNFALYFLILTGKFMQVIKSEELRTFILIVLAPMVSIAIGITSQVGDFWTGLRQSSVTVASIISTTGIAAYDFGLWPTFTQAILIGLMLIGGCAGSTAGGFKVSRVVSLSKISFYKTRSTINPRSVNVLRIEGKPQDDNYINSILFYTVMYVLVICIFTLILSFDPALNFEGAITATLSGFNNVGPGLGVVGPSQNYAMLTGFSKTMMSMLMLFGRLEIFPLLVMMSPNTWKRRPASV